MATTFAVIMAGGSGTRFWPASRKDRPKQFLPITGGRAMLAETYERLRGWIPDNQILVVTHQDQAAMARKLLPRIPRKNILAEPEAKNTAATVGWAAHHIWLHCADSVAVVLPADHMIEPKSKFQADLKALAREAATGGLCTIGIKPDHPATGYGYLERGKALGKQGSKKMYQVKRFAEKPNLARAKKFVAAKKYSWNSGMFAWRTDVLSEAIRLHLPRHHRELVKIDKAFGTRSHARVLKRAYAAMPNISVDYGIMEKAKDVRMLEASFRWSDVGSWRALADLLQRKSGENVTVFPAGGEFLEAISEDCLAYSEDNHLIAAVGVEGIVIVRTPRATLVCSRERAEDVKAIVEGLKKLKRHDVL